MSQENVETFRRVLAAYDRRDRAAWLALCDQDYEVVPPDDWPEPDPIRGRDAGWDFYVDLEATFGSVGTGDAEVMDAGPDNVVVRRATEVRGRASGAGVELSYWMVITFREGKVLREQWFKNRADALEAVGLSE